MLLEKRNFIKKMISSGRIKVDIWEGQAHIMKQDKSGFKKWSDCHGYKKTMIGGWNIALHEVIAVASGLDVVDKDEKLYINHINGNKQDCRFFNLEAINNSQNNAHAWKLGLKQHSTRRLTVHDVLVVKTLLKAGHPQKDIAKALDISPTHINSIATGHRWSRVKLDDYVVEGFESKCETITEYINQLKFEKVRD